MDKDLLQKHQNDPAWAEVIRLYSGLFDTQDEREDFILDLANKDILLAAECDLNSTIETNVISCTINQNIINLLRNEYFKESKRKKKIKNKHTTYKTIEALILIGNKDIIIDLFKKYKIKHTSKLHLIDYLLTSNLRCKMIEILIDLRDKRFIKRYINSLFMDNKTAKSEDDFYLRKIYEEILTKDDMKKLKIPTFDQLITMLNYAE